DYDVYAWHPAGSNRTTSAPHIVRHASGTATVIVNQTINGGYWNWLGRYGFVSGNTGYVRITDAFSDGSVVVADAIRFVSVEPVIVYTNQLAGFEWRAAETATQGF